MTEDRMPLAELLEKAGDGDFLRAVAEAVLQLLMEADVEGLIGAGRYQRNGDRTTPAFAGAGSGATAIASARSTAGSDRCSGAFRSGARACPREGGGQLLPAVPGGPEELGEGADRGDPGGLDRRRVDPAGR
jgi:hypothetical protein